MNNYYYVLRAFFLFYLFFLVWQQSNQLNALSKNNLFSFCLAKNTKDKATHKN